MLDGKPHFAGTANELLLIARECGLTSRIERTPELSEEGVIHVDYSPWHKQNCQVDEPNKVKAKKTKATRELFYVVLGMGMASMPC